jgi:hypothetical protein
MDICSMGTSRKQNVDIEQMACTALHVGSQPFGPGIDKKHHFFTIPPRSNQE